MLEKIDEAKRYIPVLMQLTLSLFNLRHLLTSTGANHGRLLLTMVQQMKQ